MTDVMDTIREAVYVSTNAVNTALLNVVSIPVFNTAWTAIYKYTEEAVCSLLYYTLKDAVQDVVSEENWE